VLATSHFLKPGEEKKGKDEGRALIRLQVDPALSTPTRAKEGSYLVSIKGVGVADEESIVEAERREHSKHGTKDIIIVDGLEPATSYMFKVAYTDGDNALGPWSRYTGTIVSSDGTPAEMLANTLRGIQSSIGRAVEKFQAAGPQGGVGGRHTLAEAAEKTLAKEGITTTPGAEDLLEECRQRAETIVTRQTQIIESRKVRTAVEEVIKECNLAVGAIEMDLDKEYKVAATKVAELPQDVLEAATTYQQNLSMLTSMINQIPSNPPPLLQQQKQSYLAVKEELENSGNKLASALEESVEYATYQVDWSADLSAASNMIETLKKAEKLVGGTSDGSASTPTMGSATSELVKQFEALKQKNARYSYFGSIQNFKPSINKQESVRY